MHAKILKDEGISGLEKVPKDLQNFECDKMEENSKHN